MKIGNVKRDGEDFRQIIRQRDREESMSFKIEGFRARKI
jgi:hypothetical protein